MNGAQRTTMRITKLKKTSDYTVKFKNHYFATQNYITLQMKKLLVALFALFFILFTSAYFLIPNPIQISKITLINCSKNGIYRYLADQNRWQLWWPKINAQNKESVGDQTGLFIYNTSCYRITKKLLDGIEISIQQNDLQYKSLLRVFSEGTDSVITTWDCTMDAGSNPIKRILAYRQAVKIKKNMDAIVESLRIFAEKKENIYTIEISKSSIADTLLIATKHITSVYPTTKEIYDLLNPLKNYAIKSGASQTGSPMLNVTRLSEKEFQSMVAIPINKELPAHGNIFPQKMIPGNFIVTQIKGGVFAINNALEQIQNYFDDYHKTSMAIPFQSLVTDRSKETDTSKWITNIYAPVMK